MTDRWVVVGHAQCPYCTKTEEFLAERGISYQYFNSRELPAVREFLLACGLKVVPQIYKNGQRIGDYADLRREFEVSANPLPAHLMRRNSEDIHD